MLANVERVLDHADKRVDEIEAIYETTLREQHIPEGVQELVSDAITNYRKALERTASAIGKANDVKGFTYWPNAKAEPDFEANFDKTFPRVRAKHPEIAEAFKRHQSFQPGHAWVADLMSLYRTEQHHDFTPQTRQERPTTTWANAGAGIMIGGGASISIGPGAGIFIGGKPIQQIEPVRITYVDWLFTDTGKSALGTLKAIREGMRPMLHDICSASGL